LKNSPKGLKELNSHFIEMFGNISKLKLKEDYFKFISPVTGKKKQFGFEIFGSPSFIKEFSKIKPQEGVISSEQIANLKSLYSFCSTTGITPTDFSNPENWGLIGDKLYILDYRFDQDTSEIYNNTNLKVKMNVAADGSITLIKK